MVTFPVDFSAPQQANPVCPPSPPQVLTQGSWAAGTLKCWRCNCGNGVLGIPYVEAGQVKCYGPVANCPAGYKYCGPLGPYCW